MAIKLVEIAPGRFRVKRDTPQNLARSEHPVPYVISDTMDPVEQVDGRFYSSKAAFRAVGKAHGLTEVGNEKFAPKQWATTEKAVKEKRRKAIHTAIQKVKAGMRSHSPHR
jgi:electron transfer flavoprotein alpha/beta subunit